MVTPTSFWGQVDRSAGPNACWSWTGLRNAGYGCFYSNGRRYAHRYVLELALGRVLGPRMVAMHDCDNPLCCNPVHLREGTRRQNSEDMVAKGRAARGERHGVARLTESDVRAIRALLDEGSARSRVAVQFGMSRRAIDHVARGTRWAWLS